MGFSDLLPLDKPSNALEKHHKPMHKDNSLAVPIPVHKWNTPTLHAHSQIAGFCSSYSSWPKLCPWLFSTCEIPPRLKGSGHFHPCLYRLSTVVLCHLVLLANFLCPLSPSTTLQAPWEQRPGLTFLQPAQHPGVCLIQRSSTTYFSWWLDVHVSTGPSERKGRAMKPILIEQLWRAIAFSEHLIWRKCPNSPI